MSDKKSKRDMDNRDRAHKGFSNGMADLVTKYISHSDPSFIVEVMLEMVSKIVYLSFNGDMAKVMEFLDGFDMNGWVANICMVLDGSMDDRDKV